MNDTVKPICLTDGVTNANTGSTSVIGKAVVVPAAETAMAGSGPVVAAGANDYRGTAAAPANSIALTRPAAPASISAATEPCQGSWI